MQKIGKLLKTNIKKYKLEDKIKTYEVLKNWEKIIGDCLPEAAGKTMAVSLEHGVLTVASLSRELAEMIKMLATRIMDAVNLMFGRPVVYRISCVV